jgi:hypothetical protein
MRRPLSSEQRRHIEELVLEKGERCSICGNANLRCDEDAASNQGRGYSVRLMCTNTDAAAHTGGIGLAWGYELSSNEASQVGLS